MTPAEKAEKATADRILDAAAQLIAERGYAATTTRAIAQLAGVNEVTVFRRFESKLGILRGLGERLVAQQAGHAARAMPAPEDTIATVANLARMEIDGALADGGFALRLAFDARTIPEVGELVGSGPAQNVAGLAEYFASRQAAGDLRDDIDAELMATAFFMLTSTMVLTRLLLISEESARELAAQEAVAQVLELFWHGAAPAGDRL